MCYCPLICSLFGLKYQRAINSGNGLKGSILFIYLFIYLFYFILFIFFFFTYGGGGGRAASGLVLLGLPMTVYNESSVVPSGSEL